jgi:hypothetical protein
MCFWYTPDYNGCHNCKFSKEGMTTGKTFHCYNSKSVFEFGNKDKMKIRKDNGLGKLLGSLPCDHTCENWES